MKIRVSAPTQGLVLLAPALLVYCLFAVYPMLHVVWLSFMKWNGLTPAKQFVGLDNYVQVFTQDPVFWTAVRNTMLWTVLSVVSPPAIGFALALALNQNIPGRSPLRALFYMPVIIAPIAVATMWRWMYDPFFGLFNATLTALGLQGLIQDWLGDRNVALYSMFIGYIWQTVGFSLVLFLAGLQNVSQTLVEASRIDGAGRFEVFRYVTLPALRPAITIVLILSVINSLKAFDIVCGMTGGGPAQSTQMLALWAYTQAMQLGDFGKGSAISVVLLLITLAIVIPYLTMDTQPGGDSVNAFGRAFRQPGLDRIEPVLVFLWLVLIVIAIVWIAPFVFIVFTSLKANSTVMGSSAFAPPTSLEWSNFTGAWARGRFSTTVFNSAVITFVTVPLGLFISAMAAYALSRIRLPAGRVIFLLVLFGTMLPFQVMLAPLFTLVNSFGLINTKIGVILPYLAFGVPYQVFILHGFFSEVPKELSEAALVDGASHFTIFRHIFLPISLPVLAALLILDFVATWNEFAMALVILQDNSTWTLPLGLMSFQSQFQSDYGQLNAAIVMTVLPATIVYLIFQRYFVSGLTTGAIKE
jgi:ABC-type sugar transport system permease subunit